MGLFSMVEDRPTPKAVYNWRVYMCAAVAAFAAVMIGYDSAFIGGSIALDSFKTEFNWKQYSADEAALISANIVSCYQAGAFFGAFFAYPAGFYMGRKKGLQIFSLVFLVGAGIMLATSANTGFTYLYAGRVLAGIGVGGASNLTPIYISELSPPAIRGRLVGLYELGWQIGGLVGFWINYAVTQTMQPSHKQWIVPFAVQLIPAGMMFAGLFFIRESPRWLLSRGQREKALANLCWIRKLPATDLYMMEEVATIESALEHQRTHGGLGFWVPFVALFKDPKIRYRFLLGGSLFFWQNTSGINAINYYSPTIFKSIGIVGTSNALFTTGIFGIIKTVVTLFWLFFLIDRLGRRKLLMIGAVGGSASLYYVGAYIKIANPSAKVGKASATLSSGGISAMAFFYLWTIFYTPTWNGTPWVVISHDSNKYILTISQVLNSEIFPQNVRTLAQAFAAANNWFWNFLVARFTPQMFLTMGFGVYFFFASLMILSAIFVYFLITETKGIPLEAMDRLFDRSLKPSQAHAIVLAECQSDEAEFRHNLEGSDYSISKEKASHIEEA
jgi:sugar porter (SP) family MFS transporter